MPPCCPKPIGAVYWSGYFGNPQNSPHYNAATGVATIVSGSIVYLDHTPGPGFSISLLIVEGSLVFDHCNSGTELAASSILIQGAGLIQIGKSTLEFPGDATIKLREWPGTGIPTTAIATVSAGDTNIENALLDRGLVVANGGTLRLYGKNRGVTWTHLDGTAPAQAFSITMADPPLDLEQDDEIVIASTDFDQNQAEERSISSVSGSQAIFLDDLSYQHYGAVQNFEPVGYSGNGSWDVDERAEVGLLNRNVKILGELTQNSHSLSPEDYGHVFFYRKDQSGIAPPKIEISWVEFKDLGILGVEARYPVHFHEIGDLSPVPTLFIKNSSVRNSRNRGIVVHSTSDVQIENNVVCDVVGHGIYLENDQVKDCTVLNNLSLVNSILTNQLLSVLVDRTPGNITLRSLNNNVQGNAAAGSAAYGIYLELYNASGPPTGMTFAGNSAHSCQTIGIFQDASILPTAPITFTNSRVWKCREHGMWIRSLGAYTVSGLVAADCRSGFYPASKGLRAAGDGHQVLQDSLFVGETGNWGLPTFTWETNVGRSLPQDVPFLFANEPNAHELKWDTLNGVEVYDGYLEIEDCRFAEFEDLDLGAVVDPDDYRWAAAITSVAKKSTWINDPRNIVRDLEWGAVVDRRVYFRPPPSGQNQIAFTTIVDEDDSLGYGEQVMLFPNTPFLASHSNATLYPDQGTTGLNGYAVPLKSATLPLGAQHGQLAMRLHIPGIDPVPNDLRQTSWLRVLDPSGQPAEGTVWTAASVPTDSNEGGSGVFVFPLTVEVGDWNLPAAEVRYYRMSYPLKQASALPTTFDIDFRFAPFIPGNPGVGTVVFLEIPYELGNGPGGRPSSVKYRDKSNSLVALTEFSAGNTLNDFLTLAPAQAFWHVPTPSGKRLFLKLTSLVQDGFNLYPDGAQTGWEITK